jgi:hypothetical protein
VDDLAARLLAAIEETERVARGHAQASDSWEVRGGEVGDVLNSGTVAFVPCHGDREHIAHNDPHTVLRRCAADRKIVAEHSSPHTVVDGFCAEEGAPCTHAGEDECQRCQLWPCPTLLALAEAYGITEEASTRG